MMERRNYYALEMVVSFVALFTDSSLGFAERCDLTQMNRLNTEMVHKLPLDLSGAVWTAKEPASLCSKILEAKTVVGGMAAPRCSSRLSALKFY